jgi:hypothetical protein
MAATIIADFYAINDGIGLRNLLLSGNDTMRLARGMMLYQV